jgi:hypothetical protein
MHRFLATFAVLASILASTTGVVAQSSQGSPIASPEAPVPGQAESNAFEITAMAGADPTVTEKGYFTYELSPNTKAEGSVLLRNPGTKSVTIELSPVDAKTAMAGGSDYSASNAPVSVVGSWLDLDKTRVTIAAGEEEQVGFKVMPPEGIQPGQYLAGIAAFVPSTAVATPGVTGSNQTGAGFNVQVRYVIAVQIDVPGEWTPALTITGASAQEYPSGTQLAIAIRNDGDSFLKPEGKVTLSNAQATPILDEPIALDTIITGTNTIYPLVWPGVPQGGEYTVDVEMNYADDKVATYRGMLTVSDNAPVAQPAPGDETQPAAQPAAAPAATSILQPWMIFTVIGLLALVVILLIVVLLRGRRKSTVW